MWKLYDVPKAAGLTFTVSLRVAVNVQINHHTPGKLYNTVFKSNTIHDKARVITEPVI